MLRSKKILVKKKESSNIKFHGLGIALITPFDKSLNVDYKSLKKVLHHVIKGGASYLVINGTTGESVTTTIEEKKEILDFVIDHNSSNLPIVYGIGGNNTQNILEIIKSTDLSNVDAILSISPYYNKPSQEGIYNHYVSIAEISPVPIILYNAPGRTGSNILPETTLKLSDHPNIIGIKEASGDLIQCMKIVKNKPDDFLLISGDDVLTMPMISLGAVGVISVLGNAFPGHFHKLIKYSVNNEYIKAHKFIFDLLDLDSLMYKECNPVGIKQLLSTMWMCDPYVRLPLIKASANLSEKIKKEFQSIVDNTL